MTATVPPEAAPPAPRGLSPEARVGLHYLSLMMPQGLLALYAGVWMTHRGLTPDEVGLINAVPIALMLVLNWGVGRLADRLADWRSAIVWGACLSAVLPLGLLGADGFVGILLVWAVAGLPSGLVMPVLDAAALRLTLRRGSDFGRLRALATVGYMAVLTLAGWVMGRLGPGAFVWAFAGLASLRALTALALPRFRAGPLPGAAPHPATPGARRIGEVLRPWFLLPLGGWSLASSAHMCVNTFAAILWQRQGIELGTIGLLIAVGALAETAALALYDRLGLGRRRARTLILVAATVGVGRWALMALEPPLPLLVPLQMLHGVTYGMGLLACIRFIGNWTSDSVAAEAQSLFVTFQQGSNVVVVWIFGWLMAGVGSGAWWACSAAAGLGAAAVWASTRMQGAARG